MSTSAGEISTVAGSYTLVFSPEDDGYATTIGIWSSKRDNLIYCSNLHGGGDEAIKLPSGTTNTSDPLYITVFPRGTGSIYAKCTAGGGIVVFFIAGRYLL